MSRSPAPFLPQPPGWAAVPRKLLQRRAAAALIPAVEDAAFLAWRDHLPAGELPRFCRKLQTAIHATVALLSRQIPRGLEDPCPLYPWLPAIPPYWEPAEAPGLDRLMPVQRCAYRWAAAILGRFVRDELRDLRDLLEVPPDRSPVLNRAVRDAALAICIQDPVTGYLLARHLTTLPRAAQVALDPDACPLERTAGAAAGPDTANTPVQPPAYLGPVAAKG